MGALADESQGLCKYLVISSRCMFIPSNPSKDFIKARICQLISEDDKTSYDLVFDHFNAMDHEGILDVLTNMYIEGIIVSNKGIIRFRGNETPPLADGSWLRSVILENTSRYMGRRN